MIAVEETTGLATEALFPENPIEGLTALTKIGKRRAFRRGELLMNQGDVESSLHIILWGRVQVRRQDSPGQPEHRILAELGPGEVVGEMGVIEGEARSASVVAIEDTESLEVQMDRQTLTRTLLESPEVLSALLRISNRRLRMADRLQAA